MTETQHSAWHELKDIEQWFKDHDYIVNKIVTEEWDKTDPRWVEYLSERSKKRARQDTLKAILGD